MSTKYTYSKTNDFPNGKINLSSLESEIEQSSITKELDHINVDGDDCDVWFLNALTSPEHTTLSGVVSSHTADYLPEEPQPVELYVSPNEGVPYDRSKKLRVHQTSRKLGTRVMWTGIGDDPSDPTNVGGGEKLTFTYKIGDTEPMVKYIDFNIVENETWLHEGYLTWHNAQMDTLSLQMVPRITSVTPNASGNYDLYGGYLVVPAVPGEGSYDIVSDITTHSGGLVYMPNNDLDEAPTAYWNADWNSSTQEYENITAAPAGDGRYNMFAVEVVFAEFIRNIPLLSSGFIALNSSDTDQMGHGMRLKMIADTNLETADDHDWSVACIMCLHRESSV